MLTTTTRPRKPATQLTDTELIDTVDRGGHNTPCRRKDPEAAYPLYNPTHEQARMYCHGCPIMRECRELALRREAVAGYSHGIWGGLTAATREHLLRERRKDIPRSGILWTWSDIEKHAAAHNLPLVRTTWYTHVKAGTAPQPVPKGDQINPAKTNVWKRSEVLAAFQQMFISR